MEISFVTFIIVCPLVFLAGFVDSIGGGGGLISLPAYMLAGLPPHMAVATNKLSSACGTTISTIKFIKEKLVHIKLAIPTVICAMIGSFIGAKLSLLTDERVLKIVLIPILFIAAFFVINKNLFGKNNSEEVILDKKTYITACIAALIIGGYDGFYGPGTGTFLIIVLNVFAKLNIKTANAHTKIINLTTNLTSLAVFIMGGQVVWIVGLAAAACNMGGNYLGAKLALEKGAKITRPIILIVLALLAIKIISGK